MHGRELAVVAFVEAVEMIGFPKPRPRILDRVARKRELEAKDRAFRKAVWARDEGFCRACGVKVKRTVLPEPYQGHVHHRHGRRVRPEDRFKVGRAVLLCAICHADPVVIARFRDN